MKNKIIFSLILLINIFLMSQSICIAQEYPLKVDLNIYNRWGGNNFFQGMPITFTVYLMNELISKAETMAKEQWRLEAQKAEKDGAIPPEYRPGFTPTPNLMIKISDNNVGWIADIKIDIEQTEPFLLKVLQGVNWFEKRIFPDKIEMREVILGRNPIWATMEVSPEMSATLTVGKHRIIASYPNSSSDTCFFTINIPANESDRAILNYELAEYSLKKGEYSKAIESANKASGKLSIEHDMIYLTLGDAFLGINNLEKAVEAYEEFLKTYESSEVWHYPQIIRQKVEELKRKIKAQKEEGLK